MRTVAISLLVVAAWSTAACGADAVDPAAEAQVLADTCRGLQERSTGRPAQPVPVELIERFIRSEPGGERDASTATVIRRVCQRAMRGEVPEE